MSTLGDITNAPPVRGQSAWAVLVSFLERVKSTTRLEADSCALAKVEPGLLASRA